MITLKAPAQPDGTSSPNQVPLGRMEDYFTNCATTEGLNKWVPRYLISDHITIKSSSQLIPERRDKTVAIATNCNPYFTMFRTSRAL
ncbi:hypothetical protein BGZ65_002368, partial [Modicella reniformis]